jgi:EAL domain-containing protein (putative c-di-GMP-specific phosphodiesterase class I)
MNDISSGAAIIEGRRPPRIGAPPSNPTPIDPGSILTSLGFLAYNWDISSGALTFAGDPLKVLPGDWGHRFETMARLEESQLSRAPGSRQAALFGEDRLDDGSGVPYALSYRLRSKDGRHFIVEESGRWFAGLPGRPMAARGLLRVRPHVPEAREAQPVAASAGEAALHEALQRATQQAQRSRRGFALLAVAANEDLASEGSAARLRRVMRRGDALLRIDSGVWLCVLNACDDKQLATAIGRLEAAFAPSRDNKAGPNGGSARRAIVGATWKGIHADAERLAAQVMARAREQICDRAGMSLARAANRRRAVDWQAEILSSLNERRFVLAYQPVVRSRSRDVAFYEGLLRLRNRSGRLLPASVFIPASEKTGLVALLDQRVIELAADELRRRPRIKLSINASPASLTNPEWLGALRSHAALGNVFAGRLIIEITESMALVDIKRTAATLDAVKQLGIEVAIDDFGSGHTSFRALRELPIDIIKIDGTFVQDVDRSSDGRFFIRTLVDLARHLGCRIVGEWVETEASAMIVEKLGVDYLQGRLLGAPRLLGHSKRATDQQPRRLIA